MSIVSYAQNFEDVMLWRALKNVGRGFYIDVGAAWTDNHSVTKAFYDKGWNGINIEPNPDFHDLLQAQRGRDVNLKIAVSDKSGNKRLNYIEGTGLSTLDDKVSQFHSKAGLRVTNQTTEITTLSKIWSEHVPKNQDVHFLKVDVEGIEKSVIGGNNWQKNRPWIVVVEAISSITGLDVSEEWEPLLLEANYHFVYHDGLNRFYIADEHLELLPAFKYPPNVFDGFLSSAQQETEARVQQAETKTKEAEAKSKKAETKAKEAEAKSKNAETKTKEAEVRYQAVINSRSWKITAPLRSTANSIRSFVRGSLSWLTLKSSGRSRRIARTLIVVLRNWVLSHPEIKVKILYLLQYFPRIKILFNRLYYEYHVQLEQSSSSITESTRNLSFPPKSLSVKENFVNNNERVVLFYVEHTSTFERITGVQRVCYKLAAMLESWGEKIILVKLDTTTLDFTPLNTNERNNFLKKSGRNVENFDELLYDPATFSSLMVSLRDHSRHPWLIIPEVTYHVPHHISPISRIIKLARDYGLKVGAIFYDCIPFLSESAKGNNLKHADYMSTIALADAIWPISNYSCELMLDYYRRYEKLCDAELPIISVCALAEEMDTPRQIENGSSASHNIVCIGTIDDRKNQITLIKAFNKYCEANLGTDWKLHIIGMVRDDYKDIVEKEGLKNTNITLHYNAEDTDIQRFYMGCKFTVFPSLEEGFGLPVVESLWNLKPCICANFSSMAELAIHGGCLAIDTRSVSAMLGAITDLIEDEELYRRKVDEIIQRPIKTWYEYAGDIVNSMNLHQFGKPYNGFIYYWIDATLAANGNTGIQRVNRQLAKNMILLGHKLIPIKWDEPSGGVVLASPEDLQYMACWNGPAENSWTKTFEPERLEGEATYLLVDLPLNRPLDVQREVIKFFQKRSIRCAAIFYDAIPHKLEDIYPQNFSVAHREYMEILDAMDLIMPISNTSANDIMHYLNLSRCRALALEERVKSIELPSEFPDISRHYDNNFSAQTTFNILVVGTVEPRKNHETIIKAFFEAERKSIRKIKLTICGGEESFDKGLPSKITQLIGNSDSIKWIKNASDKVLGECYEKVDLTVFPSIEEGFGLPIVESLWFGIPCVCSNTGQMSELAARGGCETVDVLSVEDMSNVINHLANNPERMVQLKQQINGRYFKSWENYAAEVSGCMRTMLQNSDMRITLPKNFAAYELPKSPVLSICISTYNRADWLFVNLENLMRVSSNVTENVEIVVCDNCSADSTPQIVKRFLECDNFRYYRNSTNIGMLGNLPQTVSLARGDYVWLIGDDDLLHDGALERVLDIIKTESPTVINVNYAYSSDPKPPTMKTLDNYLSTGTTIAVGGDSGPSLLKNISAFNENFYTAIYTFIVRKKHAQKIFNQDTNGAPFSSLQTCVPSSKFILAHLMEQSGYWINEPLLTINMNVSWVRYAPLWVMERIPEVYDLAELNGVPQDQVDHWRRHTSAMVLNFLPILFQSDFDDTSHASFDVLRFIRRSRHIKEFRELFPRIEEEYTDALRRNHPLAKISVSTLKEAMKWP